MRDDSRCRLLLWCLERKLQGTTNFYVDNVLGEILLYVGNLGIVPVAFMVQYQNLALSCKIILGSDGKLNSSVHISLTENYLS